MKKLSIVTPSFKSEKYLKAYFENITSMQGFSDYKIILILNQPTAKEQEISKTYKAKYPDNVEIAEVPLESIGASTNRGFLLADTEYVTCADVDDIKINDCFSRQLTTLANNLDSDVTYGDFLIVTRQGQTKGLKIRTKDFNKQTAIRNSIVGPNHFFRRKLLEKCGLWDEQFKSGSDFDFQIREAFNASFKKTSGGILLYYTRYDSSGSASSGLLQQTGKQKFLTYGNEVLQKLKVAY
jgi:glycosyltransferase involved in cell wall biosynthesis